jgi:hypothetical protein
MSDENEVEPPHDSADAGGGQRRRKRRRRRKKRGGGEGGQAQAGGYAQSGGGNSGGGQEDDGDSRGARGAAGGRRQMLDFGDAGAVFTPSSGRNPHRKRSSRARRGKPGSTTMRRRKVDRVEMQAFGDWLAALPDALLANLYRGLGGQPNRVESRDRMIQLSVRAVTQGGRLAAIVKHVHERDRKALAALLQCGGLAHGDELHRLLVTAYGGHERDWKRALTMLAERGLVMASGSQGDHFFYIVPDPLVDGLVEALDGELALPTFDHEDVRIIEHKPFSPPLDFSITSLATYLAQTGVRLTQRQDVFRHDQDALNAFFGQIWESDSELFHFHLEFLMMHGLVELRGDHLYLDTDVMEEWLQLEPEDQRDLIFRALEKRFDLAEWVLWAVHGTGGKWVAERPLSAMYRHWKKGKDWRARYRSGVYAPGKTNERDSFTFAPLVQSGLLEMGQWGQEKFYRLTPRALALLEPPEDDGFRQFYLTPDFKMMAPAGLAPILLFRMGEIAEFTACDRANTYKITEQSIERALDKGWRRDDVLQFLRENSQLGLPENVEQTLKGWIGHRGDVEFHDLMLITVHRSQIRRLEGHKRLKPYILHRFAPGMYAIDRSKRDEIERVLAESGFSPNRETRTYPGTPEAVEARAQLHKALFEAREAVQDPMGRDAELIDPRNLQPVPGTRLEESGEAEPDMPPEVDPTTARQIIDKALSKDQLLQMVYLAKTGQRIACEIQPERLALKDAQPVLVGLDVAENERRSFMLDRIERLRAVEGRRG